VLTLKLKRMNPRPHGSIPLGDCASKVARHASARNLFSCKMLLAQCLPAAFTTLLPSIALAQAYTPATIRQAYGFNLLSPNYTSGTTGSGQTIAIIDAYSALGGSGQSNLYNDVNQFDTAYGLPALTPTVLSQTGTPNGLPTYNAGWAEETTLDVEYAHAIAPGATIELIEAKSSSTTNLFTAASYAASHGATVVSMSFGGSESSSYDSTFNRTGVTFVASSGDNGSSTGVSSPADSQYVIGVGGSSLTTVNGIYSAETAWSGSGGGISKIESRPSYQNGVQTSSFRTVPDVAYDADPNTGVNIVFNGGNVQVGGTSIGTPQWAGLFALVDQERAANQLPALSSFSALQAMYATYGTAAYGLLFHDITSGSNGSFSAATGYDDVTGLGSPIANELVPYLGGDGDSFPLSIPNPEPASGTMIFLGCSLMLGRRKRR
jgi:subtilase family serine protease